MSNRKRKRQHHKRRKAAVMVLLVMLMPFLLAYSAFAIDLGYIIVVQTQLQTAADASVLAAANHVVDMRGDFYVENPEFFIDYDDDGVYDEYGTLPSDFYLPARNTAQEYTQANPAGGVPLDIDLNASNDPDGDLVFGRYQGPDQPLDTSDPVGYNAVRVIVRRDTTLNGQISLFFGSLAGWRTQSLSATAQASFKDSITGVGKPPPDEKSSLMPFAVDEDAWNDLVELWENGTTDDSFAYDGDGGVDQASDGIPEINMFPGGGNTDFDDEAVVAPGHVQITPGNFGTVEVGGGSSSTARLSDQILNGPSGEHFDYHGGKLDVGNGPIRLDGDPGISAGMQDELQSIVGETRSIFLYDRVRGTGATTTYRIVRIVAIRVMYVRLNGNNKGIWIQPAAVTDPGAIDDGGGPNWKMAGPPALTL